MSSNPKVSIVMRTKDRPIFLARGVMSVRNQTFRDWELIVVNDGGAPDDVERLVNYLPAEDRGKVSIISHDKPKGRWVAANAGVTAARGEYLIIHDDDDSWQPNFLEVMTAALDATSPAQTVGVICHSSCIDEVVEGDTIRVTGVRAFNNWVCNVTLFRMASRNFIPPISHLYRRSAHQEFGNYRDELPVLGDWEFNMRILSRYDIQLVPQMLANYHIRPSTTEARYGNSITGGVAQHWRVEAEILNNLLRADIAAGKTGLGVIANLAYDLRELRETESSSHHLLQSLTQTLKSQSQG